MRRRSKLVLPPTRNHRQLAAYINTHHLFTEFGQRVTATVYAVRTITDRTWKGSRLRWPGKGRRGLLLTIRAAMQPDHPSLELFRHESSETYRRHEEARAWVAANLHARADR